MEENRSFRDELRQLFSSKAVRVSLSIFALSLVLAFAKAIWRAKEEESLRPIAVDIPVPQKGKGPLVIDFARKRDAPHRTLRTVRITGPLHPWPIDLPQGWLTVKDMHGREYRAEVRLPFTATLDSLVRAYPFTFQCSAGGDTIVYSYMIVR